MDSKLMRNHAMRVTHGALAFLCVPGQVYSRATDGAPRQETIYAWLEVRHRAYDGRGICGSCNRGCVFGGTLIEAIRRPSPFLFVRIGPHRSTKKNPRTHARVSRSGCVVAGLRRCVRRPICGPFEQTPLYQRRSGAGVGRCWQSAQGGRQRFFKGRVQRSCAGLHRCNR